MVSRSISHKVAHRRGVKAQMTSYFTLPISMLFYSLSHRLVTLAFVSKYTLLKYFIKRRTICVPLASRYLRHMLVFFQVIGKAVYEFVFAQDDLPLNIEHDGFFADSPFNKLAVFLFRFVSLPAKLPENPIRGKAGVGLFLAGGGAIAAPFPLLGAFYHSCPQGI